MHRTERNSCTVVCRLHRLDADKKSTTSSALRFNKFRRRLETSWILPLISGLKQHGSTESRFFQAWTLYRVARQKSMPQTFVHIFAKKLTDFHFFYWNILRKICNKVVTKYTTTPLTALLHNLVKYVCEIHQYWIIGEYMNKSLELNFFDPSCKIVSKCI